jgi:hypothetical protein
MTPAVWDNLLQAFGETMLAAVMFVTLFSLGVRTLGRASGGEKEAGANVSEAGGNVSEAGAVLCFALCFVIVVFGVYLAATK